MKKVSVEIEAYACIHDMANDCLKYKSFYLATGDTGYGKTHACEDFLKMNKECVIYMEVRPSESASVFFAKLINTIGDLHIKSSIRLNELIDISAEKFINSSHNMLLIIDQINKANPRMYEYLHEFRDLTKENTGIFMLGTPAIKKRLDSWVETNYSGISEFRSRIDNEFMLPEPDENDIVSIIRKQGINDKRFEKTYKNLNNLHNLWKKIKNYEKMYLKSKL